MHLERYTLYRNKSNSRFYFFSSGPKGKIRKVITYQKINDNLYNLVFGDWDKVDQIINDQSRSNNDDHHKVLSTVAHAARIFINSHPYAIVFAKGQTPAKTRLYQMGINREWQAIIKMYRIKGLRDGLWEDFCSGINYEAFAITLRENSIDILYL